LDETTTATITTTGCYGINRRWIHDRMDEPSPQVVWVQRIDTDMDVFDAETRMSQNVTHSAKLEEIFLLSIPYSFFRNDTEVDTKCHIYHPSLR
jgi:hypothetical protein